MAEKKFSGAPFGTQTARFDVTGVHPNKKVPGTFTQIPYDKPSTMELGELHTKDRQPNFYERMKKIDQRMNNIRKSIASAKKDVHDISSMGSGRFSYISLIAPSLSCRGSLRSSIDEEQFLHEAAHEIENSVTKQPSTTYNCNDDDACEPNTSSTLIQCATDNEREQNKTQDSQIYETESPAICNETEQNKAQDSQISETESSAVDISVNQTSVNHISNIIEPAEFIDFQDEDLFNADNTPNLFHPIWKFKVIKRNDEVKIQGRALEGNPYLNSDEEIDAFIKYLQYPNLRKQNENGLLQKTIKENKISEDKDNVPITIMDKSKNSCQDVEKSSLDVTPECASKAAVNCQGNTCNNQHDGSNVDVSQGTPNDTDVHEFEFEAGSEAVSELPLKQATSDEQARTNVDHIVRKVSLMASKSVSLRPSQLRANKSNSTTKVVSPVILPPDIKAVIRLHTATTPCHSKTAVPKTKDKQVSKDKNAAGKKTAKKTQRKAPAVNVESAGNKPTSFKPKRVTEVEVEAGAKPKVRVKLQTSNAEGCDTILRRKLGPGAYNTIVGGFSQKSVDHRASGPGWGRQLEVERLASLPHLLYKEQWEENRMLKRKLGPGSYEIKDFIQKANEKPRSGRGICDNLAPRFEKGQSSTTPGPGTYGIGGVPQRALEEKDFRATSTKGMLDKGDRKRTLPSVGSHLGPGTYRHKTCTEEMLNKVTSLKGPYKLYSGDRNKPISEGYFAAPQLADLGPGQYEIGSFVDDMNRKEHRIHGRFGKMAQYPEVPTERLFLFSQAHCPRRQDIPGPGAYTLQEMSTPTAVNSPGFLSSAKRDDKMSQKFFTRNFNPVGAGRYDVQKFDEAQDINGHSSVFKSKSGKPTLQMAKFLQERIRGKDVSVENRVVLSQPHKMTRSLTVM